MRSEKCLLRAIEPSDSSVLYTWENNTENWKYSGTLKPYSKHIIEEYLVNAKHDIFTNKQVRFIICTSNNFPIGTIDLYDYDPINLRAGIGVLIGDADYRNQGYATQALQLLIHYTKHTLNLKQVYCSIQADNEHSVKLFNALLFKHTGTHANWYKKSEYFIDELFYQLQLI